MARSRTIKQGFFTNDLLGRMNPRVRLLFAGLWTIADRAGRLLDRPAKIKADVMPYDRISVDLGLEQLASNGFLVRYEVGGVACIQIVNWLKHQHPHPREAPSDVPPPDGVPWPGPAMAGQVPEPDLASDEPGACASPVSGPLSGPGYLDSPPTPLAKRGGRRNGRLSEQDEADLRAMQAAAVRIGVDS
jgi:hypothetical protein